jgi:hypothetical protein
MTQTAVEFLLSRYVETNKIGSSDVLQAKQMERKQILDAYDKGESSVYGFCGEIFTDGDSEQYYNVTYGNNSKQ